MSHASSPVFDAVNRPHEAVQLRAGLSAFWQRLHMALSREISPYSLAMFRIMFGALLLYDVIRYSQRGWITSKYVTPDFYFRYEAFAFLPRLPEAGLYLVWSAVGVFAFAIMIGAFYRWAVLGFVAGYGYFFVLDKAQYMNHHYMVLLFAILLLFVPAQRAWSVDAMRGPVPKVRLGHKVLLAIQIEIILITAGLVKLSADWLNLMPLKAWLQARQDDVFYGGLFQYDWVISMGAYSTVALHIIGAPLLLWRRTRLVTFIAYCAFHLSNAQLFQIGIFPFLTIGATLLLFAPDWPSRYLKLPEFEARDATTQATPRALSTAFMIFLVGWSCVQLLLPWRNALYDNEVRWTMQGARYSWRMKIYDKSANGFFVVKDPRTREEWLVDPRDYLTRRQTRKMLTRPDMIIQMAHHIEDKWTQKGYEDVSVHASIRVSLNERKSEDFVKFERDLTKIDTSIFMPMDWLNAPGPTHPLPVE